MKQGQPPPARAWPLVAIAAWGLAGSALGALLLGRHLLPFRIAPEVERFSAIAALQPRTEDPAPWTAVHVLYAECRCSHRVVEHILQGPRPRGFVEVLLWAGRTSPQLGEVERRGIRVVETNTSELARRYAVEATPLLVVVDPAGAVRYAGGYGTSKQSGASFDTEVMSALRAGRPTSSLPLYGCASSERLRSGLLFFR